MNLTSQTPFTLTLPPEVYLSAKHFRWGDQIVGPVFEKRHSLLTQLKSLKTEDTVMQIDANCA